MNKKTIIISSAAAAGLLAALSISTAVSIHKTNNPIEPEKAQEYQLKELEKELDKSFPERNSLVSSLPYPTKPAKLNITCRAAILIDEKTGSILYEKNADEIIPPASMTKLVEMFVVFDAIKKGEATLDDIVPLPPESWSENLPWDASRMNLSQGDVVTLRELLLGLSIASGNDASIAVANYIAGSMDAFVDRMNQVIKETGLEKTHFVESSGYSENNLTTPREFAAFTRKYVMQFPNAIKEFHSKAELTYPQSKNRADAVPYTKKNTNPLLGILEGCDGIKTGYIDESGYNLALSAERNGRRFIAIIMGGQGTNTREGNFFRVQDGTELMNFAFSRFADYIPNEKHSCTIAALNSKKKSMRLVPAYDETFTVPFITGENVFDTVSSIKVTTDAPKFLYGTIEPGQAAGQIIYSVNNIELRRIPLVAETSSEEGNIFCKLWAEWITLFFRSKL